MAEHKKSLCGDGEEGNVEVDPQKKQDAQAVEGEVCSQTGERGLGPRRRLALEREKEEGLGWGL